MKNLTLSLSLSLLKNRIKQNKEKAVILLLSVLISVLFVSTITYGATTIGSSIDTGGNLTVSGNATLGDNSTDLIKSIGSFYASSTLQTTGAARFYSTLQTDGLTTLVNATTSLLTVSNGAWFTGGNLGLSTTSPWGLLSINPNGISGPSFVVGSSTVTNFLITNSGNVGIGTTSPGSLFSLNNIANFTTATSSFYGQGLNLANGCFSINGTCVGSGGSGTINSGTTGQLSYYAGSGTTLTATSSLFIHSNQNIGIGTTTPNWLLQAAGTRPFFTLSDTGAGTDQKHWFLSSQGGNFYVGTSSDALNATSTYLTIANGGNVGIGTTNPAATLHIAAGNLLLDNNKAIQLKDAGGTSLNTIYMTAGGTVIIGNTGSGSLSLWSANGEAMSLDAARRVGIGDNEPDARLEVSADGGSTDLLMLSSNDNNDGDRFVVRNSGLTGIGTTTPNWKLQVASSSPNGTFFALSDMTAGVNLKHWLISNQNGNLYFATSSDAYATSTSNLLNLIFSNYSVGIGTTSPTEQLSVSGRLFVGGTGTSTIQNNLYVMGTLRSTVSYVGDLIFSNNFKFIETPLNAKIQSLFLQNQYGENLFKIDENGNLSVKKIEAERGKFRDELETKNIKIGSPQNRTGITIYDKDTGKPYCIEMRRGQVVSKEGECK